MTSRHHRIADDLRHQITTGRIRAGERLPSETDLAAQHKVSTSTLRSALAVLEREGLVEKVHGKGNFVRRPVRKVTYVGGWGTLDPWTAADAALHVTVRTTAIRAHGHLTTLLRVPNSTPLTEFLGISYEGDTPHSLARIYVPRDLAPTAVLGDRSSCAGEPGSFAVLSPPSAEIRETVSARLPTPDEASSLRISSTAAVLAITRIAADGTGRVVEAAHLTFPGDRVDAIFTTHHVINERQTQG
ncbi:GntR family transcriptional regulator [Streptomyces sp. RY43-2]|uniref:GntR family transcriptional regulator n=1 Tax=Streptomyces macrolidinus TaxID=2952607 RepID=A0ABT0ZHV6_9ACTN|nr:GntR family transcriptional regulator [Streptomyces macrolidinus]MCN9243137.1 GntR family transcriptional regulator [Streptomyces macrolidinus]